MEWLSYQVRIQVRKQGDGEQIGFLTFARKEVPVLNNEELNTAFIKKIRKSSSTEVKWEQSKTITASLYSNNSRKELNYNNNRNNYQGPNEMGILLSKLDILIDKLHSMEEEDLVKTEWRIVAMTIDRCLLYFFALVFLFTLCGCFLTAPGYVP